MDSRDSNVHQNLPTLCKNGCGFYANSGNEGLCSVCYKEFVKKKQAPPTNMPASFSPAPSSNHLSSNTEDKESASETSPAGPSACALDTAQPTIATVPVLTENDSSAKVSGSQDGDSGNGDGKKKKNRCFVCKKKVGLTGFTCRCGGLFCSIHRYTDKHECTFDYKAMGAEEISKSNPVVVAQKVAKI